MRRTRTTTAIAAILLGVLSAAAQAETVTYRANLSGANEMPANDSGASGEAVAAFDTETRVLSWTVTFTGLSSPLIGAHLHGPAAANANAGVLLPLDGMASPIRGSAVLSEEKFGFLDSGAVYVNLHTERFPGGELRGNLER